MDLKAIMADVEYVLGLGKMAISLGADIAPFVLAAYNLVINKTTLTDAERSDLQMQEDAMRAQLNEDTIPADSPA